MRKSVRDCSADCSVHQTSVSVMFPIVRVVLSPFVFFNYPDEQCCGSTSFWLGSGSEYLSFIFFIKKFMSDKLQCLFLLPPKFRKGISQITKTFSFTFTLNSFGATRIQLNAFLSGSGSGTLVIAMKIVDLVENVKIVNQCFPLSWNNVSTV